MADDINDAEFQAALDAVRDLVVSTDTTSIEGCRRLLAAQDNLLHMRAKQIATLLQRCADLTAARDAWQEQALAALNEERRLLTIAHDATSPGPTLVAETRAAFPARALRGGNGVFMG
jgi:hypothetical protein